MTDSTLEDDEPTSFGQKTKNWYEKHKPKIRAVGGAVGVAVAVALVVAKHAVEQNAAEDAEYTEETEETEDTGSAADSAEEDERRKPPIKHNVAPYKRRLPDGREIDVSGYERGGSSDDEDEDEDEDEDPGEAAA
ncbi:hypothetical protein ABZT16_45615 [Streptomyces flaveolus]|uniref:Uncharacterized protein n=1 Tax=Streptomyces flaveolus TaxID=67297 RepID=A0ABV3AQA1_9ACTN